LTILYLSHSDNGKTTADIMQLPPDVLVLESEVNNQIDCSLAISRLDYMIVHDNVYYKKLIDKLDI